MLIEKFDITTSKLNLFKFPKFEKKDVKVKMQANLNLEIIKHENNKQNIILTYNLKSFEIPVHIFWECCIILFFDEELTEDINKTQFFNYSEVISAIDKEIELVSKLSEIRLPLLSETIGD